MGTPTYVLQHKLGFLLYRCSCKTAKMSGLVKNAVFVTNGKGHPCAWGWAVTTPCSLAALHAPMQGCCQYSSNQLGLRETEVNSQHPCAQKYRRVILKGVSETHYIKCLCPVPLLDAELASLCTNKMCNGFASVFLFVSAF